MRRQLRKLLPFALVAAFGVAPLLAASLPEPLEIAIVDAERRHAEAEDLRFTFTMRMVNEERDVQLRYDPQHREFWTLQSTGAASDDSAKRDEKMRERLATRAAEAESAEDGANGADEELLVSNVRDLIGGAVELHRSEEGAEIYRFPISNDAEIFGGGDQQFDVAKYLTGEIGVQAGRIVSMRFFATEPFKPVIVAKIETFDLRIFFEEIWEGGPYVTVRQLMQVDGSAFFKSFAEKTTMIYDNFERR